MYPPSKDVWSAFEYTPFESVRVVIIGQDPYFNAGVYISSFLFKHIKKGQAHGLCFSVREGVTVPPSLNRIYKEIASSVPGFKMPKHGYLEKWAKQGLSHQDGFFLLCAQACLCSTLRLQYKLGSQIPIKNVAGKSSLTQL